MSDDKIIMDEAVLAAFGITVNEAKLGAFGSGKSRTLAAGVRWSSSDPARLAEDFVFQCWSNYQGTVIVADLGHSHPDHDHVLPGLADSRSAVQAVRRYLHALHAVESTDVEVLERMYSGHGIVPAPVDRPTPSGRATMRWRIRRRRRLSLAQLYEGQLESATRLLSDAAADQSLATAASNRAVAAVLMDNDWLGLQCLLAADSADGTSASAVARNVDRDRDEVAVALANLVQQGLLVAADGLFKQSQLGAVARSRVTALTNR
jgi:hypothetical protein